MKENEEAIYEKEIRKLFPEKVDSMERIMVGSPADIKYLVEYKKKWYMVKATTKYNLRDGLPEEISRIAGKGIPIVTAKYSYFSRKLKRRFFAYPWVQGQNLEEVLEKCGADEKYRWGEQCGRLLKRFHDAQTKPQRKIHKKDVIREYRHCRFYCYLYGITFPHKREYDKYFIENKHLLKKRKLSVCHMDYQPKNIMLTDNDLCIIDYESAMLTDPWWDLCTLFMGPPKMYPFLKGLINGYFSGRIPKDFFRLTCLMTIVSLYRYAMWKMQNKGRRVVHQAENIYQYYDGLENPVPDFLREYGNRG